MNKKFYSKNSAALVLFRTNAVLLCMVLATVFSLVACEKADFSELDDEEESGNSAKMASLTVVTRSGDDEKVSYPVSVYVMDDEGKCVDLKQLDSASDELKFSLSAGTYDVYAIAGADEDSYELPTKDNAQKSSEIKLREDMTHGDLMASSDNVVVAKGEKNTLTLTMTRKVSEVDTVKIEGVPDDVTAVEITLSPLVKNICLDGSNSSATTSKTFPLSKSLTSGTWVTTSSGYILESTSNLTISVGITNDDGKSSYACNYKGKVEANHKLTINGKFNDNTITLQGVLTGTKWGDPVTIDFEIGGESSSEGGSSEDDKKDTDDDSQKEESTAVGSVYDNCLVIRSEKSGDTTILTLMAGEETESLSYSKTKKGVDNAQFQQAISECVSETFSSLYSDSELRLPTEEEVKYLADNVDEINDNIDKLKKSGFYDVWSIPLSVGSVKCGYYYKADDGNIYVYTLTTDVIDKEPNPNRKSYRLRGFKTVEVKAE